MALHNDWMDMVVANKRRWEAEPTRRRVLGNTDLPESGSHPDDIKGNPRTGEVRIAGTMTRQDNAELDAFMAHKAEFEAAAVDLEDKFAA